MGIIGRIAIVCLALTTSVACLAPENTLMAGVDVLGWSNAAAVSYCNCDSLTTRNLNITLRYNDKFTESALPLKVGITTPDSLYFEEVVTLQLHHPRTALSVATVESLPYRNNVILAQNGEYKFAFTPLNEVCGVEAIGIEFLVDNR